MNKIKEYFKLFMGKIMVFRYPVIEQWAFLLFVCSLGFLSLTGFFFFLFIAKGLHGYFLLFHVAAGCVFAVTLTILVVLRAAAFCSPDFLQPEKKESRKKAGSIHITQAAAAWIIVISGFIQALSSLVLMVPLFKTEVNIDITSLHRWAGLIALLAAVTYASFERK